MRAKNTVMRMNAQLWITFERKRRRRLSKPGFIFVFPLSKGVLAEDLGQLFFLRYGRRFGQSKLVFQFQLFSQVCEPREMSNHKTNQQEYEHKEGK